MQRIFFIHMDSLFPILFWGNVISFLFLLICLCRKNFWEEKRLLQYLIFSRLSHSFYYFVASGRDILPDLISVSLGGVMLFIGFYFEAQAILRVVKENTKFTDWLLRSILTGAIVLFNAAELAAPLGGIRITTASLGVFAIMTLPVARMLLSRDASIYTRPSAAFYVIFLLCLLARAWYGLQHQSMGLLTNNILQSVTFLSLLLQLIVALPSYTLIIKDYADKALLLMATTDRLTGATNRHAFLDAAAVVYRNSSLCRIAVAVLFMDIDRFKQVNDTFGHAFGDVVLARFAALIDKCLRGGDLSCRYGGEEFVVLLPNTDRAAAERVAGRIMNEVRRARFDEQPDFSFTVSIGVFSGIPSPCLGMNAAIRIADEAMYQAKHSGRDQVVVRTIG